MSVINTNISSLVSQQALTVNSRALSKAMQQLSTGQRINSAADDAAGLAIGDKMTAQINGLNQAVRNANDGISMVQTGEGALQEVTNMLQRMRQLSVQSANGTYSSADRTSMNSEYTALKNEITRIGNNTQWNSQTLFSTAGGLSVAFQVSSNTSSATITASFAQITSTALALSSAITTASAATTAMGTLDTAIATVDSARSSLGAVANRLTYAADNLTSISTNTAASRSRIMDTDYAAATTALASANIIQQAGTAMLAQANQQPQTVLALLK